MPISALIREGTEVDVAEEGDRLEVAVETTPFYAESGGQVGDRGVIEGPDGRIEVEDTLRPVDGVHVHFGKVVIGRIAKEDAVTLRVDGDNA